MNVNITKNGLTEDENFKLLPINADTNMSHALDNYTIELNGENVVLTPAQAYDIWNIMAESYQSNYEAIDQNNISAEIGKFCLENQLKIATAESCTAGMIASTIADTAGSSAWLDRSFVVYTPDAKHEMLGVNYETIEKNNITSEAVAIEMAIGALENSNANLSIATTGVAGPTGGTKDIPAGTICFAWAFKDKENNISAVFSDTKVFKGNRNENRQLASEYALDKILTLEPILSIQNIKKLKPK